MKFFLGLFVALVSPALLVSCESANSRRAGGGAFDDTPMGRTLDGNGLIPDQEKLANESFEAWRELD